TLPSVQVDLSTTAKGGDGLSTVFSENVGTDDAIVFPRGPLPLRGTYEATDTIIPLSTPFFYDPRAGNLLLDVRNFGGGMTSYLRANNAPDDTVSSVWSLSVDAPNGLAESRGLVTVFNVTPVPEPGVWSLAGLIGVVCVCVWWAGRWRKQRR